MYPTCTLLKHAEERLVSTIFFSLQEMLVNVPINSTSTCSTELCNLRFHGPGPYTETTAPKSLSNSYVQIGETRMSCDSVSDPHNAQASRK